MSAHMFLLRNESSEERLTLITEYIQRLKRKLGRLGGYYGASAWQSTSQEQEVMILIEFREDREGDEAMSRFTKDKLALDETRLSDEPADLTVFDLDSSAGVRPADAPTGSYLSISRRIAPPGFGTDLELELDGIFGYLAVIPGYLGHVYGSHATISDQVLGLVLWKSEESFRLSLPKSTPYELKLFRKIL